LFAAPALLTADRCRGADFQVGFRIVCLPIGGVVVPTFKSALIG
jgi:hypothetical protein